MKKIFISFALLFLSACAARGSYHRTPEATSNFSKAHTDCKVKAAIAVPANSYGIVSSRKLNNFMEECMAGEGWVWQRD